MLKTTLKIAALSAVSLTLLSACGAASKLEDAADRAQDELDNAADRAENERERLARLTPPSNSVAAVADRVSSVRHVGPFSNGGTYTEASGGGETPASALDNSYNITATESQDTFALRQVGENLVMTVNGTDYTFTPGTPSGLLNTSQGETPPTSYGWDATGANLNDRSNINNEARYIDLRDVLDGTHPEIQGTYVNFDTTPDISNTATRDFSLNYTSGFATVGMRTPTSVVASQTATATYTGLVQLNVQSNFSKTAGQSHSSSFIGSTTEFLSGGTLNMTANFTANTIAGEVKYSAADSSTSQPIPNRGEAIITFNSAPIVGNGFAGTFTMNSEYRNVEGITNNPTGNYTGNFFGPAADDIAGVMRFEAQSGAIGIGGFRGDRQVPTQ